jgi:hypothetical protein
MPVLGLPESPFDKACHRSWKFLEEFGARSKPDLAFYVLAIKALAQDGVEDVEQTREVYRNMARFATSQDYTELRYVILIS